MLILTSIVGWFLVEFSWIFMFISPSICALLFECIFDDFWWKVAPKMVRRTLIYICILVALWLRFGSLCIAFGWFWLLFGSTLVDLGILSAPFCCILAPFWPLWAPVWTLSAPLFIKSHVFWIPEFAHDLQIAVRTSIKGNLPCMHAFPTWPGAGTCRRQFGSAPGRGYPGPRACLNRTLPFLSWIFLLDFPSGSSL